MSLPSSTPQDGSRHTDSWSSQSSCGSLSSRRSPSSTRNLGGLLMPEPPPGNDSEQKAARMNQRRRALKRDMFDNAPVDWKSIPAMEESTHDQWHLYFHPTLRCDSSVKLRAQVIADARVSSWTRSSEAVDQSKLRVISRDDFRPTSQGDNIEPRDFSQPTVEIDGDEMFDMIG